MSEANETPATGSLERHTAPKPEWRLVLPGALKMLVSFMAAAAVVSATPGCRAEEPEPVVAAKRFAVAIKRGDVQTLLELVEAPVAERLASAAARASDQVGGRRNIEPHEMLQIVDVDPTFQVAKAELVESDAQTATVRLTGADGKTHDLGLVNEDGQWHVVVPLPPP
ncbi:MAG: hypothetical protein JKY37_32265 [Nannocystaceae bacterium]|nr:hypothetical protein [Nannocystaceae bacterium]